MTIHAYATRSNETRLWLLWFLSQGRFFYGPFTFQIRYARVPPLVEFQKTENFGTVAYSVGPFGCYP